MMEDIKKRVDRAISVYLPVVWPEELYRASRHLLDAGGKRLRPVTLLLAAEAVGGDLDEVMPAAVSLELVHNFTLIHDDIMDQDDLRKGMPAVHVKWGVPGAIVAGDTLYSKAFEILAQCQAPPERVLECISLLATSCTQVCEGQWLDISFEGRDDVTEKEYLAMVEKKTAVLYAAAAKIGGILAGASQAEVEALWEYGRLTGIGFQIYDDILDLIAQEKTLGKVRGSDLMEGKRTLIAIHALEHGVEVDSLAGQDKINRALKTLQDTGSIDYAHRKALEFVENGKSKLETLPESQAKNNLIELADFMVNRKY